MGLTKRGKYYYGTHQLDIRDELLRYSRLNEYVVEQFADAICDCGHKTFGIAIDDNEGAATRTCAVCGQVHPVGDSEEYLEDAELETCACPCGIEEFELTVGVSLYEGTDDVKWIYLGCRCPECGLTAVYGHWKNEYLGYQDLLRKV